MTPVTKRGPNLIPVWVGLCLLVIAVLVLVGTPPATADTPVVLEGAAYVLGEPFYIGGQDAPIVYPTPQSQPALQLVRQPDAVGLGNGGQGVVIAVVDSGVAVNHPYLQGSLTSVRRNFVAGRAPDDVSDVPDGALNKKVGHGTFIAGLIRMVAPNAQIMPVRVLNGDAMGTADQVAAGVRFAADNGANVINLSMGTMSAPSVLKDAVNYAVGKNIVVVASVGNNNLASITNPGLYGNVLSVTATDDNDRKAVFSNYKSEVDVSAPGVNLYSTYWDGTWTWGTGTSFSAALVTGEAALIRAAYPKLDVPKVRDRIKTRSVNINALNPLYKDKMGKGRIDMYQALLP